MAFALDNVTTNMTLFRCSTIFPTSAFELGAAQYTRDNGFYVESLNFYNYLNYVGPNTNHGSFGDDY